jgi:hypothetical protein
MNTFIQFDTFIFEIVIHVDVQGHVSNEPIFPTEESMKLYDMRTVLLKNSNVARGHSPVKTQIHLSLNTLSCAYQLLLSIVE